MKKNKLFKAMAVMFISIFLAGNLAAAYAGTDYVANSPNKNYKCSLVQSAHNTATISMTGDDSDF